MLLTEVSLALGHGSSSSKVDKQVFSHMIVVVFAWYVLKNWHLTCDFLSIEACRLTRLEILLFGAEFNLTIL